MNNRHLTADIALFYVLTLAFSWSYWIAIWLEGAGRSHLPGLLGPMLAALVVAGVREGRGGVLGLLAKMVRLSRPVLVLGLVAVPLAALVVTLVLLPGWPDGRAFLSFPGIPPGWPVAGVVITALVVNGYGEETGWRGLLFDRLEPALGPLRATLVVVPLWALWHVPAFLVAPGLHALLGPAIVGWAIGLALGAVVLSYLYLVSGRSILAVALWHASFNFATATPAAAGIPAAIVSTLVMLWGAAVLLAWWRRR